MAINTATAATATGGVATQAAQNSKSKLSGNFDTFLTLLTTQLKNQSPTDPLDTNQMTQQLVQFAGVEQQISMNGNLEKMIALQTTTQLTAAAPLLGQTLEVTGDHLAVQNGKATLRLPAAAEATRAHVVVASSSGRTLHESDVTLGTAAKDWQWNGRGTDGKTVPDGAYRVTVNGLDIAGQAAPLSWTVVGKATSLEQQNGSLKLMLGNAAYDFAAVRSVVSR